MQPRLTPTIVATLAVAAAMWTGPHAALPPDTDLQPPVPHVVRIDTLVTDSRGKPILDLRSGDFDVRDDGVHQTIDSVERVDHSGTSSGRLLALFLDEYHVGAGTSTSRVREALLRFVDQELRPDDLIAVMKPLDPLEDIRFTRDREGVRQAIATFAGRKDDYRPRTPFEQSLMRRAPAAVRASRDQVLTSDLQTLALQLGGLRKGRKAIVLVSEGFSDGASPRGERRLGSMQAVVYAADRSNVAIYSIDPRPAQAEPIVPNRSGGEGEPAGRGAERGTLAMVADQTGGRAVFDAVDLLPGLRAVVEDLDNYYLLSYRPSSSNDGKFHAVQVAVKRADALIRSRTGYWAPMAFETRGALTARLQAPNVNNPRTVLPTAEVFRTRTAREFSAVTSDPDAPPVSARVFSRTERLVIRVPAYGTGNTATVATANLLNRAGQTMRELPAMPSALPNSAAQFDLPLAALAPGEYSIELTIKSRSGETKEAIVFRVTS